MLFLSIYTYITKYKNIFQIAKKQHIYIYFLYAKRTKKLIHFNVDEEKEEEKA